MGSEMCIRDSLIVDGVVGVSTFTQEEIDLGLVFFQHTGEMHGVAHMEFELSDGTSEPVALRMNMYIDPVNDAPLISFGPAPVTVFEGSEVVLGVADIIATDIDTPIADISYRVSASSQGEVVVDGMVLATNGSFTHAQLSTGLVSYRHDGSETTAGSITLAADDGALQSADATLDIVVDPVNDEPTLATTTMTLSVPEGGAIVLSELDLIATDADNPASDFTYQWLGASNGVIEVSGIVLPVGDEFTHSQLVAGSISFRHDGGETTSAVAEFSVSDGSLTSSSALLNITVSPVNDAPELILTSEPLRVLEGGLLQLGTIQISADDAETQVDDLVYEVGVQTNGRLEFDGLALDSGFMITHQQVESGMLGFRHDGSETSNASIELSVVDGDAARDSAVLNISVQATDDPPVWNLSSSEISVDEGAAYTFTVLDLDASDTDNLQAEFQYRLIMAPTQGSIQAEGIALSAGDTFTQIQLESGLVVYRHDGSEVTTDGLSLVAFNSNGATSPNTVTITINELNDLPTISYQPVDVVENTFGADAGELLITDADVDSSLTWTVSDARFQVVDNRLSLRPEQSLDFEANSTVTLDIEAVDERGGTTRETVVVNVLDINEAPEPNVQLSPVNGDGFELPENFFIDADGDVLEYSATSVDDGPLPEWLDFDAQLRRFVVLDSQAATAEITVVVKVLDGRGGASESTVTLLFEPAIEAAVPEMPVDIAVDETSQEFEITPVVVSTGVVVEPAVNPGSTGGDQEIDQSDTNNLDSAEMEEAESTIESVDLQSLIAPLPKFGSLELTVLQEAGRSAMAEQNLSSLDVVIDTLNLSQLLSPSNKFLSDQSSSFAAAMDRQKELGNEQASDLKAIIGSSVGITSGLSVGYLIWLIRGGTLMGSMLSSLPAWRFVDPLPVLGSLADEMDETDADDKSLASLVGADQDQETDAVEPATRMGSLRSIVNNIATWKAS